MGGNCSNKPESGNLKKTAISKNNFRFENVIGKGGFGKVWSVLYKKNKTPYAMKEMSKARILTKKSVNSVMNEKRLLENLKNP